MSIKVIVSCDGCDFGIDMDLLLSEYESTDINVGFLDFVKSRSVSVCNLHNLETGHNMSNIYFSVSSDLIDIS